MPEADDREWYLTDGVVDLEKIRKVAEWLLESDDTEEILYLLEKPWKFGDYYKEAMEAITG